VSSTAAFADLNYGKAAEAEQSGAFKAVTEAADKWVRMGVDGFRLDAVKHIYHNAYNDENPTFLKKFYDRMNESYKAAGGEGDFYMVGEMLDEADKAAPYYRGLPALFEFTFWYKLKWALQNGIGCYFVKDILDVDVDILISYIPEDSTAITVDQIICASFSELPSGMKAGDMKSEHAMPFVALDIDYDIASK